VSGALAGLAPGGGEADLSTSKSATVSFELPAKEAIVARPAAGVGVAGARRGEMTGSRPRRRRGVGTWRRAAPGVPRAPRGAATALSGTRSVLFVQRPRGPSHAPAAVSRIVAVSRMWCGDAAARSCPVRRHKSLSKATDFLVSYMPLAAHPSAHSLLHTEEPSRGPGTAPRRPR